METLTLLAPTKYQSPYIKEINKGQLVTKEIMKTEDDLNVYEKLIGKYQGQLQLEISLKHFKQARIILNTIENIDKLSNGMETSWNENHECGC